jgi:SCP-2 sterol transfer family
MSAAKEVLRVGGKRVARLDRRPRSRRLLLHAIPRAIPRWFDSGSAQDLSATFELVIRERGAGELERFAISIAEQRCAVTRGAAVEAGARVEIGAEDMILLASGSVGWPELLSSGRLVLSGDPFLALRFPTLFRLPVDPHLG